MNPRIRTLLFRTMPHGVLRRLRCWHAPRVARRFTDAHWPFAPVIRALVSPGDSVVDVGANMGYITTRLADYVGASGRVYAVEPVPDTFEMLECTVRALSLRQVTSVHACASDQAGEVWMAVPCYAEGGENLYESRVISETERAPDARCVQVRSVRLDELLSAAHKERLTFIKIDVEGHEAEVVRGTWEILRRYAPALLIEVSGNPDEEGSAASGLFGILGDTGYQAYGWDGRVLRERQTGEVRVDYLFLQPSHRERLSSALPRCNFP